MKSGGAGNDGGGAESMRLPEEHNERSGVTPTVISAVVAVTLFVGVVLAVVLVMNSQGKSAVKQNVAASKDEELQSGASAQDLEEDSNVLYPDTEELISGSKLTPADLDFWDKYPVESEETPSETPREQEQEKEDPSTDGKHTLVVGSNGKEEWVLISPYLPKHEYDFTKLVCQSNLMKYYVEGKQVSFVGASVSKNQDYVDFVKLKKAGIDYVMIRVGARGYSSGQLVLDEYFNDNIKRAADAGLEIGVYFFSQAVTEQEAVEEANMVLESVRDYKLTYPVAFDMEHIDNDTARIDNLSKSEKTKIAKAFLDTVKNAGYIPMLYGDKEWLIKEIDMSKLTAYDIWLAQIQDIPDYPYAFAMWQYNNAASIDGIAGYADLSISFIDYSEK